MVAKTKEVKELERTIKDLRSEVKEEHEWRMRLHENETELKRMLDNINVRVASVVDSLIIEHNELLARTQKIESRLEALGHHAPEVMTNERR